MAAAFTLVSVSPAQTLRLGPFDLTAVGTVDFAYDSNVDDVYPSEEVPGRVRRDFYWMPGLSISAAPVPVNPSTVLGFAAGISYQDYFVRNDLDTELYFANLTIQARHPRLTLGGLARVDYSVDNVDDVYAPGELRREPVLTQEVNAFANWNYRKLRLEARTGFKRERYEYVDSRPGDQDETRFNAGAYYDLFRWGSLFYTWERTITVLVLSGDETDETTETIGLTGGIPIELLRRPQITYQIGVARQRQTTEGEDEDTGWEFVHTVTVSDEIEISKTTRLSASASWVNAVAEDKVAFVYNILFAQQVGPRAQHALQFTQEPRRTLGSTSDTEATTYSYNAGIRDVIIGGLGLTYSLTYAERTPLGVRNAVTEKTLTHAASATHSRAFSRKLNRTLSYRYTWEDSNIIPGDPKQKHLIIYGLRYVF